MKTLLAKYIDMKTEQGHNMLLSPTGHLGVSRSDMPQIHNEHRNEFIKFIESNGVSVENKTVRINTLRMAQGEYNRAKVHSIIKQGDKSNLPIFISKDNYVLDGNHRMLAKLNTGSVTIKVIKLGLNIKELLPLVEKFPRWDKKSVFENVA